MAVVILHVHIAYSNPTLKNFYFFLTEFCFTFIVVCRMYVSFLLCYGQCKVCVLVMCPVSVIGNPALYLIVN